MGEASPPPLTAKQSPGCVGDRDAGSQFADPKFRGLIRLILAVEKSAQARARRWRRASQQTAPAGLVADSCTATEPPGRPLQMVRRNLVGQTDSCNAGRVWT